MRLQPSIPRMVPWTRSPFVIHCYLNNTKHWAMLHQSMGLHSVIEPRCYDPTIGNIEIKYYHICHFSALLLQLRQQFGCADEIVNLSGREVRHCNWMRFVQSSSRDLANVVAMRIHGDVVLMVISKMAAYCEVRMLFTKLCYDSMPMFSVVVEDLTGTCH